MPKVSIIIPVYNTECYLNRCLESVGRQTLGDFEVICVDDCSTDGSLESLKAFSSRDSRFKVLTMPLNSGLSLARNKGLDCAKGDYVYFLDSDDWIDEDFLEVMCMKAEEYALNEVVNSNYIREYSGSSLRRYTEERGSFKIGFIKSVVIQSTFCPAVWCRLFRRSFLEDNKIRFSGLRYAEDLAFSGLADLSQEYCYIFKGPAYHYFQREGSLIRSLDFSYRHVLGFISLYNTLMERSIPTEGVRLFATYGAIILDTDEKYQIVRDYALKIVDEVRNNPDLYILHDRFLIEALVSSGSYVDYCTRFHENSVIAYFKGFHGRFNTI